MSTKIEYRRCCPLSLSLTFTNTKAKRQRRLQGVVLNSVFVVAIAFASAFALFLHLIVAIK